MSTTHHTRTSGHRQPGAPGRPETGAHRAPPSIREVCLLGVDPAQGPVAEAGGHLDWAGRSYRVVAGRRHATATGAGYVHLAPDAPESAPGRAGGRALAAIRSA